MPHFECGALSTTLPPLRGAKTSASAGQTSGDVLGEDGESDKAAGGGRVRPLADGPGLGRLRRACHERIADRQPADGTAVLQIFAVENVAAGLDGGGDDERIVEGKIACSRANASATAVGISSQWYDIASGRRSPKPRSLDIRPGRWRLRRATLVNSFSTWTLMTPPEVATSPARVGVFLRRETHRPGCWCRRTPSSLVGLIPIEFVAFRSRPLQTAASP